MIRLLLGSVTTGILVSALTSAPILAAVVFAAGVTASLIWGLS